MRVWQSPAGFASDPAPPVERTEKELDTLARVRVRVRVRVRANVRIMASALV